MSEQKKILIVDDDPLSLKVFSKIVADIGFLPITADNGKDGLKKLEDHPDTWFIFTDYKMPVLDGPGMIKHINKNKKTRHIPIVLFSAVVDFTEAGKLLERGVKGFIEKPIHKQKIQHILDHFESIENRN